MKQVSLEALPPDVQKAIRKAQESEPQSGPGLTACIALPRNDAFVELQLHNKQQLSTLAMDLVAMGFVLSHRRADDCDFVLEADSDFAPL